MAKTGEGVAILGVFVADLAFRAARLPAVGETIFGSGFKMGPGGKGSNQAVAAARLGAPVTFITRIGKDAFGDVALSTWRAERIQAQVTLSETEPTGVAFIYVNEKTGENAIIVDAGAANGMSVDDAERAADVIRAARVFVTQLEQPVPPALRGLEMAREAGAITVFNPAPAQAFDERLYPLCDYITPNESETSALTGLPVTTVEEARKSADILLGKGVGAVVVTLGEKGALFHNKDRSIHLPAFDAGPALETAGAGDAFNGGFAVALGRRMDPVEAVRFANAVAGLSVTRAGTAPSMPTLEEVEQLLARTPYP